MATLSQHERNAIARALNNRPRKRFDFKTPQECLNAM
jgi:IS30 family transposase